jgi:[ribosomal protein S5]-alanine N-acetyltransferase
MLETPRLILRPMEPEDRDSLLRIFTDPRVMASFGDELFTPQQMERWLQRNLEHQEQYGYGLFAVILKEAGHLIGDCGLQQLAIEGATEIELGYDFLSAYWNQGLATEAALAVRDYAFQTLHLPRIVSIIRPGNIASRRVAEKVSMDLEREVVLGGRRYWLFATVRDKYSQ